MTTSTLAQAAALHELGDGARLEDRLVAAGDRRPVGLEQLEQPLVAEGGHLDRLARARPARWRSGSVSQRRDVDDDRGRLVERADEVLALGQVDAGLAADRRVDLGDERRRARWMNADAAQVGRGEEPGRVAEGAATDRDERLGALDAQRGELAGRGLDDRQSLGGLALGQQDLLDRPAARRAGRPPAARRRPPTRRAR